jgi:bifunctional non-homologous end joining protein LigD
MCAVASKHRTRKAAIRGAERAEFPGFIEFCHPEQRAQPPAGPDWIHEVKADGYRAELVIHAGVIKVHSRRGHDWSKSQFAAISKAAGFLRDRDLVMDGEVVALNSAGRSDFNLLRHELAKRNSSRLQFHAFDLLYLDGYDLRRCRLDDRKEALRGVLANAPEQIVFVDRFEENGQLVFEQACRFGLEGIVSKRRDAPYRSGEQATWIKIKCKASDSYPIIAFVEKLGAKPRLSHPST